MIQQLIQPIPLQTPKGRALAHLVIDPGLDMDLQWVCFMEATGECWTFRNPDIRAVPNETLGHAAHPAAAHQGAAQQGSTYNSRKDEGSH